MVPVWSRHATPLSPRPRSNAPQSQAEVHFPDIEAQTGIPLSVIDTFNKKHQLRYRFWINNASRMSVLRAVRGMEEGSGGKPPRIVVHSCAHHLQPREHWSSPSCPCHVHTSPHRLESPRYLLENTQDVIERYAMTVGDVLVFARNGDGQYYVCGRRGTKEDVSRSVVGPYVLCLGVSGGGYDQNVCLCECLQYLTACGSRHQMLQHQHADRCHCAPDPTATRQLHNPLLMSFLDTGRARQNG